MVSQLFLKYCNSLGSKNVRNCVDKTWFIVIRSSHWLHGLFRFVTAFVGHLDKVDCLKIYQSNLPWWFLRLEGVRIPEIFSLDTTLFKSISKEPMQINFNKFYLILQMLTICIEIAQLSCRNNRPRWAELRDEPYAIESVTCYTTRIRVIAQNYHRIKQIRHQSQPCSWSGSSPESDVLCARMIRKIVETINPSFVWCRCNCDCIDCHYTKCPTYITIHSLLQLLHFLSPNPGGDSIFISPTWKLRSR